MSPVDAIRPPDKKPVAKKSEPVPPPPTPPTPRPVNHEHRAKERMIWIIAGSITVIILIGWLILYSGGALTDDDGTSFFGGLTNKVTDFWETVKTDVLKLQSAEEVTETVIEEEEIRQLEEQVFPQFNDPENQ